MIDPLFRVELITATPSPQTVVWAAMHQDYSADPVFDQDWPEEERAGEVAVKRLLAGDRGHYGPLEHPQITFNVIGFPHSVMQQARTHRVGVSFDVQSMRYTSQHISDVANGKKDPEDVFYMRPVGSYSNRQGKHYFYTEAERTADLDTCLSNAQFYDFRVNTQGFAEEHARGMIFFDIRQHFVVSFSLRAALHFLDLRSKADAQGEIQAMCDLMVPHISQWVPQIWEWYEKTRLHRARLAP